jgi:hypothetical protein
MVSYELIARVFDGHAEGLTRDDILDNITHYWLTNTGISSVRLYRENKLGFFHVKGVSIPVAVSIFPDEIDAVPRSWAERALSQPRPLQQARQRRALRRTGTAATPFRRGSGGLQIAPPIILKPFGAR